MVKNGSAGSKPGVQFKHCRHLTHPAGHSGPAILPTCDSVEKYAHLVAYDVAGKTDDMRAQTEADQMNRLELLVATEQRSQAQHETGQTFARLARIENGRRIAWQLG